MINTINAFNTCIRDIQKMRGFYIFLRDQYKIPQEELSDLLRSELVNVVSAMDRFIHEIVRAYSGGYPFSISGDIRSVPS